LALRQAVPVAESAARALIQRCEVTHEVGNAHELRFLRSVKVRAPRQRAVWGPFV